MKNSQPDFCFWRCLACSVALVLSSAVAQAQPATDPAIDPADYAPFDDALLGQHPRLLFDAAELAQLQSDISAEPLLSHYNKLLGYLGSSKVPASSSFRSDATEAQRQGLWRMPTVAMHYALTDDTTSRDRTIAYMQWLNGYTNWETGGETDSGMAAANMMVGAAICYDLTYNYLSANDPTFLEEFRQKIFHHARAMYHRGHLGGQGGYWQVDPQNNHRWHRNAGLALCMLAAYEGNPEEEWMLRQVFDELAFVAEFLPDDGTSHESTSYQVFGSAHLTLALEASDNCLGTNYLDLPHFQNIARFRAQSIAPGFEHYFMYGDMGDGAGNYSQYLMLSTSHHAQPDYQSAIDHHFDKDTNAFAYGWKGIIWRGTSQLGGDYHNLPLVDHFEDLGITFMREGWDDGAGAMFKSGPMGGFRLNEYRNANGGQYVNVAHDDPDANSFILFKDEEWVAETDRYSYSKKSSNHNTILVDGLGQRPIGRNEGLKYSQPGGGGQDMTTMAYVTWEEDNGDVVVTEGEAQVSYRGALSRFRRSFIWKTNDYVLVLDDIRADANREIAWLMQSGDVTTRNASNLEFTLEQGAADCEFDVDATEALTVSKVTSTADHRGSNLGWEQLQLKATTDNIQIVSAYDMWDKGSLVVTLSNVTATDATVTVTGNGVNDSWKWTFAPDNNTASQIALMAAPSINEQPSGEDVAVNESATLAVHRGGLGPVTYEWFQGGVGDTSTPVGAGAPTLDTGALSEPTHFWVRLTSPYGEVSSDAFLISLTNGFLLWVSDHVSVGALNEDGDPDSDGLANLLEYALGLDPDRSEQNRPHTEFATGAVSLRFSVPEISLADVQYEVEVSDNLTGGWTTILSKTGTGAWTGSAAFTEGEPLDGFIPMTVEKGDSKTFIRLNVTRI